MSVKISDLLQLDSKVEIAPGKFLPIHGLSLDAMLSLFMSHQTEFMILYEQGQQMKGRMDATVLHPFLLAAPDFVAKVIALASDSTGQEDDIKKIPSTAQLIALHEIWKLSVPDPKKAGELLSVAMEQLRRLSQTKAKKQSETQISQPSNATSAESSNSSAPMATDPSATS